MVRFFWNGLKVGKSDLFTGHFGVDRNRDDYKPTGLYFIARKYERLPDEVWSEFAVKNSSDFNMDYYCTDTFKVPTTHPLFPAAAEAFLKYAVRGNYRTAAHAKDVEAVNAMLASLKTT